MTGPIQRIRRMNPDNRLYLRLIAWVVIVGPGGVLASFAVSTLLIAAGLPLVVRIVGYVLWAAAWIAATVYLAIDMAIR